MIILLSVTISIMFGLLLGISYGWYAYKNAESTIAANTLKEAPSIVFAQTEYIKTTQNISSKIYLLVFIYPRFSIIENLGAFTKIYK